MKALILGARAGFGAGLLANGINHFAIPLFATPAGSTPLARQLLGAMAHIGLLDLAMAILLVAGTLLVVGVAVPAALYAAMPITTCAAYWAVMLERDPWFAFVALATLALNGLLLLAYRDSYRGVLEPRPAAIGETRERPA